MSTHADKTMACLRLTFLMAEGCGQEGSCKLFLESMGSSSLSENCGLERTLNLKNAHDDWVGYDENTK